MTRISLSQVIMKYFHETAIRAIGYIISIMNYIQDDKNFPKSNYNEIFP